MGIAVVLGVALGLLWGILEAGLGSGLVAGDLLAILATHATLGCLTVVLAYFALGASRGTPERRTSLACALAAAAIVAGTFFARAHLHWLASQPWTSRGHLAALAAAVFSGAGAGVVVRLAALRAQRWRGLHARSVGRTAALLALFSAVPAMRSWIPSFHPRVEAAPVASSAPYNVLLVTFDTLRADHLPAYGYGQPTSSGLERFGFTRFEHAWAVAPWTRPSTATILTGVYPTEHTAVDVPRVLPSAAVTLAERLRERGFATAHCAANLHASGLFGMSQGAQFTIVDPYMIPHPLGGTTLGEILRRRSFELQDGRDLVRMALAFLDAVEEQRFFLYLHFEDPHTPYAPPAELLERFAPGYRGRVFEKSRPDLGMTEAEIAHMVARYDGDIANSTRALVHLLEELDRRGELDRTLVILVADHGEAFGEHGRFNHSDTLYQELLSIPLLIRPPSELPRAERVEGVVSQIDILPTVLDYLGMPRPAELPGVSLRPSVEGADGSSEPRLLLAECQRIGAWSVRLGNWKLIATGDGPALELYDLATDPRETTNLAQDPEHAATVEELLKRGKSLRAELVARSLEPEERTRSQRLRARLNQLGYADDR